MKMRYVLLGLVLMAPLWVMAEEQEGAPGRTIEDLFLSQDIELQILRSQALGTDPEMKRLALRSIRAMVEQGVTSDGVFVVLEALASEGVSRQVRSQGAIVNNFPLIRREATELLGQVGGERAKNTLLRVLRDDPEVVVLAEAAYALGSIGLNQNNEVSDYLVHTLLRENARSTPDNNLAYSIVISLERLSEANGGLANPEVINALIETASSPYIRTVRMRAVDAIVNMRDHGR
ncbi:HEAT repeat domain-containing protein [Alkalispirochaeta alkalica]|uniref:HEAT repeat domain-containing protein n=1 Tax=Alkalispirochaeta alkalica TaxID=46356 RepID=UPI000362A45C|nr:HEAT repeat domain-containing protein [Alkalispirochaeta alkalica]